MTLEQIEEKLGCSIVEHLRKRAIFTNSIGSIEAEYPDMFHRLTPDETFFITDYLMEHQEIVAESVKGLA